MKLKLVTLLLLLFQFCVAAMAQEKEAEPFVPKIRGAVMMLNSHIPKATEGGKKIAVTPGWGFDVDYMFRKWCSVAVQTDVKLQSFEVEDDNVELQRSFPFAMAGVIHFHPLRHWSFYTGPGYEIEKHENLFLIKAGTEYSFEINKNFEIALNLIFESRIGVYDAWTFGIALNRKLWEKNKGFPKRNEK